MVPVSFVPSTWNVDSIGRGPPTVVMIQSPSNGDLEEDASAVLQALKVAEPVGSAGVSPKTGLSFASGPLVENSLLRPGGGCFWTAHNRQSFAVKTVAPPGIFSSALLVNAHRELFS